MELSLSFPDPRMNGREWRTGMPRIGKMEGIAKME